MVRAFAEQGSRVGFIDIDEKASGNLAKELGAQVEGAQVEYVIADLRDIESLRAAIGELAKRNGAAAVLVNNAAHDDRHDWREVSVEYWDERQEVNIRHQFFAIQAVAPAMIEAGGGSIVNIGSNSWWEKSGGFPAYTSAKSAVHGLTRSMARDLGQYRIRVNAIVPGWVMTERQKKLWVTPENIEKHRQKQCLPDLIEPVYIARMALFLASDDAAMCSAGNYMVEAGSI